MCRCSCPESSTQPGNESAAAVVDHTARFLSSLSHHPFGSFCAHDTTASSASLLMCVTRRKLPRPSIAKNDNNNGADKSTNNATMQPPNSKQIKLQPVHLSSDTPHSSKHFFPTNTQRTMHKHSYLYVADTHPR